MISFIQQKEMFDESLVISCWKEFQLIIWLFYSASVSFFFHIRSGRTCLLCLTLHYVTVYSSKSIQKTLAFTFLPNASKVKMLRILFIPMILHSHKINCLYIRIYSGQLHTLPVSSSVKKKIVYGQTVSKEGKQTEIGHTWYCETHNWMPPHRWTVQ